MEKPEVIESLRTLHDLSKAINSTLDPERVVGTVLEKTSELMGAEKVLLLLLDRKDMVLTVRSSLGFGEGELAIERFADVRSFEHCIVKKGTVIDLSEVLSGDDYRRAVSLVPVLKEMVFAPLEVKGEAYGLLGVSDRGGKVSEVELEMFCALASQAAVAMENAGLYERLRGMFEHTAEALAEAVDSRDPYTGGHTRRVMEYSLRLAEALGMAGEEREGLKLAAILHDIGKIGIDDAILRKGGVLTGEEEGKMRTHPEIGASILSHVEEMGDVMPGVLHHHERFDGTGYPKGLKGGEIPLSARIIAVVDAFDALTTNRPYRKARDRAGALDEIEKGSGTHFDPALVRAFGGCIEG